MLILHDEAYLWKTLLDCKELEIPVSEQFEVTCLNISDGKDQDFVDPTLPPVASDLIISCFIFNPDTRSADMQNAGFYSISPWHFDANWSEAAERTGAFMIKAFSCCAEITIEHFMSPSWVLADNPHPENYFYSPPLIRHDLAMQLSLSTVCL